MIIDHDYIMLNIVFQVTSSHKRRKKDHASFRVVSIYGHSRKGVTSYVFTTNMDVSPKKLIKLCRKRRGIETG
jgi:hypothetical protein